MRGAGGSATRAAAGALRLGNALGSALSARRLLGPAERRILVPGGLILFAVALVAVLWPKLVAWPLGALASWLGIALLVRAARIPKSAIATGAATPQQSAPGGARSRA
jgi:cardiolipin synthase